MSNSVGRTSRHDNYCTGVNTLAFTGLWSVSHYCAHSTHCKIMTNMTRCSIPMHEWMCCGCDQENKASQYTVCKWKGISCVPLMSIRKNTFPRPTLHVGKSVPDLEVSDVHCQCNLSQYTGSTDRKVCFAVYENKIFKIKISPSQKKW